MKRRLFLLHFLGLIFFLGSSACDCAFEGVTDNRTDAQSNNAQFCDPDGYQYHITSKETQNLLVLVYGQDSLHLESEGRSYPVSSSSDGNYQFVPVVEDASMDLIQCVFQLQERELIGTCTRTENECGFHYQRLEGQEKEEKQAYRMVTTACSHQEGVSPFWIPN